MTLSNLFLVWGCVVVIATPLWIICWTLTDIKILLTKAAKK